MNPVQQHYQAHPYPRYPLLASVRRCDTYALNLDVLWSRFNDRRPPADARRILIAGCGTFAPYPWSVANPTAAITALDLSERSLTRARLHCLLHGRTNVVYRCGSLLDTAQMSERHALIDSFGVLHHLPDPLAGLKALEECLIPGGILRIMVYSRYARRQEESIRRAFRLLGICTPREAGKLLQNARPGSRLAEYAACSDEVRNDNGIADALLHPCVHTFRIDELLEMLAQTGLKPCLFAHHGAGENLAEEIGRLRALEKENRAPGNFVLYLQKDSVTRGCTTDEAMIMLNPCLRSVVSPFTFGSIAIAPRIGCENPLLDAGERRFLRRFVAPVHRSGLSADDAARVAVYKRTLFLVEWQL